MAAGQGAAFGEGGEAADVGGEHDDFHRYAPGGRPAGALSVALPGIDGGPGDEGWGMGGAGCHLAF